MNITTPEAVGLSSERLAYLETVMQSYVDQQQTAGLITLAARRGKIAHLACYGQMDREAGKAMQPDTIFRVASMTKSITVAALMMLFEEGRFLFDTPVAQFIPAFAKLKVVNHSAATGMEHAELEQPMTIRHLLTHTSGLTYDFLEDSPVAELYQKSGLFGAFPLAFTKVPMAEVVRGLAELPLVHQPGQGWRYSVAIDVVGHLVSLIADMPLDTFLQERIFEPLGMTDSAFAVPSEKHDRFAAAYQFRNDSGLQLIEASATSPHTHPEHHPNGGLGLLSTATDYWRFAQMLLNRGTVDGARILSPKTVDLMTANHISSALFPLWFGNYFPLRGTGFGLGGSVLMDPAQAGTLNSPGTFGWGGSLGTSFQVDPQEEMICITMQQLDLFSPVTINPIFKTLAYAAIEG